MHPRRIDDACADYTFAFITIEVGENLNLALRV